MNHTIDLTTTRALTQAMYIAHREGFLFLECLLDNPTDPVPGIGRPLPDLDALRGAVCRPAFQACVHALTNGAPFPPPEPEPDAPLIQDAFRAIRQTGSKDALTAALTRRLAPSSRGAVTAAINAEWEHLQAQRPLLPQGAKQNS